VERRGRQPLPGLCAAAVRLGVKDTIDVAGFATRLGLRRYRHYPAQDAAALRGLGRTAVLAKLVTTELNIGIGSGCVNPCFPAIDPAGSSTGCGVAVAARICDVALGTDVLGSVRWPSGRCGVVGLRATHNPRLLPGMFPLSPSMDAVGWVARTADDLAVLAERGVLPIAAPPVPRRLTIGVVAEVMESGPEQQILTALDRTRAALGEAGHRTVTARIGAAWHRRGDAWELCARQAWEGYQRWNAQIADELSESTLAALRSGAQVRPERAAEILDDQRSLRAGTAGLFAGTGVDAWLLPLDPDVPRPSGDRPAASSLIMPGHPDFDREIGYTPLASYAGLPAVVFPVSRDSAGLAPLAMQLMGPPAGEALLIGLVRQIERLLDDIPGLPT